MKYLNWVLLILLIPFGVIIFHIPDQKYDYTLNTSGFISFCIAYILIYVVLEHIFLKKLPRTKRILNKIEEEF